MFRQGNEYELISETAVAYNTATYSIQRMGLHVEGLMIYPTITLNAGATGVDILPEVSRDGGVTWHPMVDGYQTGIGLSLTADTSGVCYLISTPGIVRTATRMMPFNAPHYRLSFEVQGMIGHTADIDIWGIEYQTGNTTYAP